MSTIEWSFEYLGFIGTAMILIPTFHLLQDDMRIGTFGIGMMFVGAAIVGLRAYLVWRMNLKRRGEPREG